MMKLVNDSTGLGKLEYNGEALGGVRYHIQMYQGMSEGSGLPIPGLYRIDGSVDISGMRHPDDFIGMPLNLRLEDGRVIRIVIADSSGRVFSEGHGPMKCLCC